MSNDVRYPEHEKLAAIKDDSQTIGEFLEFGYQRTGCRLARWVEDEDFTIMKGSLGRAILGEDSNPPFEADHPGGWWDPVFDIQRVLADYFDIDQEKLEAEKRQMLDELRNANAQTQGGRT